MISSRILRRRWVLAVIFGFSLVYFITSTFRQSNDLVVDRTEYQPKPLPPRKPFQWQPKLDHNNDSQIQTCRNSIQGKKLIADERGYVCDRKDVLIGGCCDKKADSAKQYSCDSCNSNGCCSIYEYCVSCCLHPEKQPLLRKILSKAADTFHQLFSSVADHFELCLAKCRTSSMSVQHENSYRDPVGKFCYGENPPDLLPVGA